MIRIFSKNECPKCELLKKQLEQLGIKFEEANVDNDNDAMTDLVMANIYTTPAIQIGKLFFVPWKVNWVKKYE